jgi:pheromone shutdown protein TraB
MQEMAHLLPISMAVELDTARNQRLMGERELECAYMITAAV